MNDFVVDWQLIPISNFDTEVVEEELKETDYEENKRPSTTGSE